jgi:NADH-quinone oxidoreductase subunit E
MSGDGKGGGFAFTDENLRKAEAAIGRYPEGRQSSAVLALLDLAQRQGDGWLPRAALDCVADFLEMPRIRVYEVATFYSMLNLERVGRHHVQVCTTTPCWLRGSDEVVETCRRMLGIDFGGTTEDGLFSMSEVECLGACVNAPMIQINDDCYEDLDAASTERLLEALKASETPKPGPQTGRQTSAPASGPTTLTSLSFGAAPAGDAQGEP